MQDILSPHESVLWLRAIHYYRDRPRRCIIFHFIIRKGLFFDSMFLFLFLFFCSKSLFPNNNRTDWHYMQSRHLVLAIWLIPGSLACLMVTKAAYNESGAASMRLLCSRCLFFFFFFFISSLQIYDLKFTRIMNAVICSAHLIYLLLIVFRREKLSHSDPHFNPSRWKFDRFDLTETGLSSWIIIRENTYRSLDPWKWSRGLFNEGDTLEAEIRYFWKGYAEDTFLKI